MSNWLAALPPGWSEVNPRRHFRERREPSKPSDLHLTPSQHLGVLSQADYMARTGSKVVLNLSTPDSMKHVEPGDFIAHLRSFQGGLERSDLTGKVSSAYTVIEPLASVESTYFRWVLKSRPFIEELSSGLEQLRDGQSIKFGDFTANSLPMPPREEQRRIADFLDDRVARIDQIVAARREQQTARQSLFETEKEAALYNASDTSAVELRRLRCVVQTGPFGSQLHSDEYVNGGWPVVNPACISDGRIRQIPGMSVDTAVRQRLARHILVKDDVVFGRRGEMGRAGLVTQYEVGWVCGTGSLLVRITDERLRPAFLMQLLSTSRIRYYFQRQSVGSTMDNLNTDIWLFAAECGVSTTRRNGG